MGNPEAYSKSVAGETPLVELDGVFAKLECVNPTGSIKDRIVRTILDESERNGTLRPGMRIVEATSGNTGIALAHYGREKGYAVTIVMPEDMTEERKERIRAAGAELVLCSKEGSFAEAVAIRDRLAEDPNVFCPDQFSNPLNIDCHDQTTGAEVLRQLPAGRKVGAFVAGVGTGGSLIGVARALRRRFPEVEIVAVEPEESAVLSGGEAGRHRIFGIGDGFVPDLVRDENNELLDPMITSVERVSSATALAAAAELRAEHGLCVGISSGANYVASLRLRERHDTVVTLFADGYEKYASHGLCAATDPECPFASLCAASEPPLEGNP
ncbi:MAG: cysteine synthase family protein [Fimbriimonadaceae bacterium]|nr:cysteine synthase family protein [Chthonomonadaceae bacterium]MCO5295766.1 cysteine synthase family protein [Fimbriimonadaceae bacterium]